VPTKTKTKTFDRGAWLKTRIKKKQKDHPDRTHFTGFCGNGHCEGTRPRNFEGKSLKTCAFWTTCTCVCHIEQDEIFAMLGEERRLVENPEYRPDMGSYLRPDPTAHTDFGGPSKRQGPIDKKAIVGEELTPDSILKGHVFHETDSGRRTKGQLEYQVLEACNKAMDIWPDEVLVTPKEIAKYIGGKQGGQEPSTGAIDAVWKRWVQMGFAETATKPVRFVDYTAKKNQTIADLEEAKRKFKNSTRSAQGEARRAIRRK